MEQQSILKPLGILVGVVILLASMHYAASFLTPVLMALFIATLLFPIYSFLKRHIPAGVALLATMAVLLLVVIFLMSLIGNSFNAMITGLESYGAQFSQRQTELMDQDDLLGRSSVFASLPSILDPAVLMNALGFILSSAAEIFKNGLLILLMTVFVMVEGPHFWSRMVKVFGPDHFLPRIVKKQVHSTISYFGLRAIVNLVTATATGLMLWLFGIEYAGLWAVLIFFLSFIPYIGAVVSMIPPLLLAYAESGLGLTIVIGLLSVVINSVAENVVSPIVMGKGLSISPTVVFLSVLLWVFILGGSGAFIAMPLTVGVILILYSFEETHDMAAMLVTIPDQSGLQPSE